MLQKLTKLIQNFTLSHEKLIDRKLRKRELDKVKQYCINQGLKFYPEEIKKLPFLAKEINGFIEDRARRDLPQEQFEDRLSLHDLSKWVEIGGVIGYNSHLYEMNYSEPNSENVQLEVRLPTGATISQRIWTELYHGNPNNAKTISSSTSMKAVQKEELERAKYIIDWHTHHVGFGEMSEGDARHVNYVLDKFGNNKPIYFVVFRPAKNQSVWYQAKKTNPSLSLNFFLNCN